MSILKPRFLAKDMKKNNYIGLLGYKIKVFVTLGFCFLTFWTIVCIVFLLLFAFDIRISVDLDNNICGNINSILVSTATGYVVSYFMYLLTVHIPNCTQTIINDRIICNHLLAYRNLLLYSFGGLVYMLKEKGKILKIPEITKLFERNGSKDKLIVEVIQLTYNNLEPNNNLLLAKEIERLQDSFQTLISLNALYKGRFSREIYHLQTSRWRDSLFIIEDELKCPKTGFNVLDPETLSLINQNFDLANKAVKVDILINSDENMLRNLYKTTKPLFRKLVSQITRKIRGRKNRLWNNI